MRRRVMSGDKLMDQSAPNLGTEPELSTMFDATLRIGLVALLTYACARSMLPFAFILL